MKRSNIQILYDAEKLNAINQYAKGEELQAGMEALFLELYEKYVPVKVREIINSQEVEIYNEADGTDVVERSKRYMNFLNMWMKKPVTSSK